MTLRVIEGYDYLPDNPSDTILNALGWSGNVSHIQTTGDTAFGYGKSMYMVASANSSTVYRHLRGRYTTTSTVGMRVNVPTVGDDPNYFMRVWDTHSTQNMQFYLAFDQFGCIYLYSMTNGNSTLTAKTLPGTFTPGSWFWFEMQWTPGTTTGDIEIRVNTVPKLVLNNIRLSDGTLILPATSYGCTHFGWRLTRGAGDWSHAFLHDDFYFLDDQGSINNTFLGNVRAKYMALTGDHTPIDFSRVGAATNWQAASNAAMDDTKYVYSPTVGDQDLYDIDPNLNTPLVYGLEVAGAYRQDDATQREVQNVIESGATQTVGATWAIDQSYTFYPDIYELNPDTGLMFTGAEANAVKVGPKVIT